MTKSPRKGVVTGAGEAHVISKHWKCFASKNTVARPQHPDEPVPEQKFSSRPLSTLCSSQCLDQLCLFLSL